jgi:hypothetical protein
MVAEVWSESAHAKVKLREFMITSLPKWRETVEDWKK